MFIERQISYKMYFLKINRVIYMTLGVGLKINYLVFFRHDYKSTPEMLPVLEEGLKVGEGALSLTNLARFFLPVIYIATV